MGQFEMKDRSSIQAEIMQGCVCRVRRYGATEEMGGIRTEQETKGDLGDWDLWILGFGMRRGVG